MMYSLYITKKRHFSSLVLYNNKKCAETAIARGGSTMYKPHSFQYAFLFGNFYTMMICNYLILRTIIML